MDIAKAENGERDHQDQIASANIQNPVCDQSGLKSFALTEQELREAAHWTEYERNRNMHIVMSVIHKDIYQHQEN
jgi:hypothetical protein